MSDFWSSLLIQIATDAVVIGIASFLVKGWIQNKFDKRLADESHELDKKLSEFNHGFDRQLSEIAHKMSKMQFVSSSLYKQRESAILDFNMAFRGLLGQCSHLVTEESRKLSTIEYRLDKIEAYFRDTQGVWFKCKLLFTEDLLESSGEIYDACCRIHSDAYELIQMQLRRIGDDISESVGGIVDLNIFEKEFSDLANVIERDSERAAENLLPKWESIARRILMETDEIGV